MQISPTPARQRFWHRTNPMLFGNLLAGLSLLALSACGGGSGSSVPAGSPDLAVGADPTDFVSSASLQFEVAIPAELQLEVATPFFHAAPAILNEPSDEDASGESRSASRGPSTFYVRGDRAQLVTRNVTPDSLLGVAPTRLLDSTAAPFASSASSGSALNPFAAGFPAASFTPAQIRAAYQLPALPSSWSNLSASQAAQFGAGQTIYIVDANDDPNAAAELAAFNTKFGLPSCQTVAIAPSTKLPLPAASTSAGCTFSVVYNTSSGAITSTAPAYNSGWAMEIALDVQWAHAIAPLARIVLIEAASASLGDLLGAVNLANAMGPGIVSMSFGGNEGSWTTSVDSSFAVPGMSYFAATGDNGSGVSWPAVSANVVAVGGTTLAYNGSGTRAETTWSGSGGGTSAFVATPSYQTSKVPGLGTRGRRSVADVSMNADPYTGQLVATMAPGSTTAKWMSVGGTSLSTPQWAGLAAIINATRAVASRPLLGDPHAAIYALSTAPGSYGSDFLDINTGSNGSCASCAASTGYDTPTGLGTPNFASLLTDLAGANATASAPVVSGSDVSGLTGAALSFTASATATNPVTWSISGGPSAMVIDAASGVVTWATPTVGKWAVVATAKDSKTGLSGQGTYNLTVTAPLPPTVAAITVSGTAGKALTFTATATGANPVTWSIAAAPSGMSIAPTTGVVTWPAPTVGTFKPVVTAKDNKTGLTGQVSAVVTIGAASTAPLVADINVTGTAGKSLSFTASATSSNAVNWSIASAPAGMTIAPTSGVITWTTPVAGTYKPVVTATDAKTGLTGQVTATVTIAAVAAAPIVANAALTGQTDKVFTFAGKATSANPLTWTAKGMPAGMTVSGDGVLTWAKPTLGDYTTTLIATDTKTGLTGSALLTIKIVGPGPTITAPAMSGNAGSTITGAIDVADPGVPYLSVGISNIPKGLQIRASAGLHFDLSWPGAVAGKYALTVSVQDSLGRSATASVPITVK